MNKNKWEKGWKVITVTNKGCRSYCCAALKHPVSYPLNKVAKAKMGCGPLAAFRKQDDAWAFLQDDCFSDDSGVVPCVFKTYNGDRRYLWNGTIVRGSLPEGTILASCVKRTGEPVMFQRKYT
jgi:hypothetical protein